MDLVLTVFTGSWGASHNPEEVRTLQRQVTRNLYADHRFVCISDRPIRGVETADIGTLPGWWRKLEVLALSGPAIWLDLDVVITGPLDFLLEYTQCELATPWNWAQSGHGGVQSSVMVWWDALTTPIETFDPADAQWPPRNNDRWTKYPKWGDQEWLGELRDTGRLNVTQIDPRFVKSYKYHCREAVPDDCRIVVFHGEPKPANVSDDWVKSCRS